MYGNALLVAYDDATRPKTWYWDGTAWRPAAPPYRYGNSMLVFDSALSKTIAITEGGMGAALQTLAWDGSNWSDLQASPPGLTGPAILGFDAGTKQLIMLAGTTTSTGTSVTAVPSTWVFDGGSWRRTGGAVGPEQRSDTTMAYDPQHHQLVLFGGRAFESGDATTGLRDTWTWDGTSWTLRHPVTSPPGGLDSLVYDPDTQQIVLLDGHFIDRFGHVQTSMWTWDGADWHELHPSTLPSYSTYQRVAYDLANHQLLLVQGIPDNLYQYIQTWVYQGGTWKQVS